MPGLPPAPYPSPHHQVQGGSGGGTGPAAHGPAGRLYSYQQLYSSTESFAERNKLGSGGCVAVQSTSAYMDMQSKSSVCLGSRFGSVCHLHGFYQHAA